MGVRPGLAEAGDRAVDHGWIERRGLLVANAKLGGAARPEGLDDDVGLFQQALLHRARERVREVEGDRALARVDRVEIDAVALVKRRVEPARIADAEVLELDDLRAEVAQILG